MLFLADHPLTGGYPVIAVVARADVGRAAQARPGQRLRFLPQPAPPSERRDHDRPLDPAALSPDQARALFREGLRVPTSGWCAGWTQANLIAVPREQAYDLLLFAQRNPKPCPVLDVTEPGEVSGSLFAGDLRTDLPGYVVYEHGEPVAEVADVTGFWRGDLVAFLIGCSFTFEDALQEAASPSGTSSRTATSRCTGRTGCAAAPATSAARWSSRCARSRPRRWPTPCG